MTTEPDPSLLEELLSRCIDRVEARDDDGLQRILDQHPEHAGRLQRILGSLVDMGMVESGDEQRSGTSASGSASGSAPGSASASASAGPSGSGILTRALPKSLGEYELLHEIGRGGMGIVYLARQGSVGRRVALKLIHPVVAGSKTSARRFRREAQAVARLRHPNVVTVFGSGEEQGILYLAMEYVPGVGLEELLHGPNRPDRTVLLGHIRDIARALQAAHDAGIIHRDVKTTNIRVCDDGRGTLLDFGLAQDVEASPLTLTRSFLGSPQFASPEQIRGDAAPTPASDIYSLGVTLYEAVTGRLPFRGETQEQVFRQILERSPVAPRQVDPTIDRALETIVLKAIEREPRRRYASAAAFANDLDALLAGRDIAARPAGRLYRAWAFSRRHKLLVGSVAAILLALLIGMVATWTQYRHATREAFKANAVNDFLVSILAYADPAGLGEGKDFTVRQALDRAAETVSARFGDLPEVEAEVCFMIGNAYKSLNDLDKCGKFYRRSLKLREKALERPHEDIAVSLNALGQLHGALGEHARAADYHRESLAMFRQLFPAGHSTICRGLTNLACELYAQGRKDRARRMFREARSLLHRGGTESLQYGGTVLGYLARLAQDAGDHDESIGLLREAADVYGALNKSRHPYAGRIQLSLGKALAARGRYEDAAPCFAAADSIFRQHYAEDHPTRRRFAAAWATFQADRKSARGGVDKQPQEKR